MQKTQIWFLAAGALFLSCVDLPMSLERVQRQRQEVRIEETTLYLEVRPEKNLLLGRWFARLRPSSGRGAWLFTQPRALINQALLAQGVELPYRYYDVAETAPEPQRLVAVALPDITSGAELDVAWSYARRLDLSRAKGSDLGQLRQLELGSPAAWLPAAEEQPETISMQLLLPPGWQPAHSTIWEPPQPRSGTVLFQGRWPRTAVLLLQRTAGE